MGLKQDLLDAKLKGLELSGASKEVIEEARAATSPLSQQIDLEVKAIKDFLINCRFRVTALNAPVVLEDFNIPPQNGQIESTVQIAAGQAITTTAGPGSTTSPGILQNTADGAGGPQSPDIKTDIINVDTNSGLQSTGYAFIGSDPFSQENFIRDINEEQGQRRFTEVKILPEDIEGL
tara:strand:+ start:385 stop:918 length:534 start_codon:yes stop_codon:yes gene_type:complete